VEEVDSGTGMTIKENRRKVGNLNKGKKGRARDMDRDKKFGGGRDQQ